MKRRKVILSPEAHSDLSAIEGYISDQGSPVNAMRYVERIGRFCGGLETASERGERRDDLRPGLRIVGFEKRVTIAFSVETDAVHILRVFYGGVDWERAL